MSTGDDDSPASGGRVAGKRNLSTFDVAKLLEVDPGSVANWIDGGLLKAHRTPGGHRRVSVDDLVAFLLAHKMPLPAPLQPKTVRIVIVDDEPAVTQMISRAIKSAFPAYEVAEAHDGFKAGAVVATVRPDVVVLDLLMPGIDGFEVCRTIKSQPATQHATVLAITAYPSEENIQRALECGAKSCLAKPVNLDELVVQVQAAVESARR
jgi:excisionase family DNA binding protein